MTTIWRRPGPDLRLVAAVAAIELAVWPGQVPHGSWLTALVGGLLAAQAWALATVVRALVRLVRGGAARRPARFGWLGWLLLTTAATAGFVAARAADVRLAERVGTASPGVLEHVAGAAGGGLLAVVLVLLPRGVRTVGRLLAVRWESSPERSLSLIRLVAGPVVLVGVLGVLAAPAAPSAAAASRRAAVGVAVSSQPATWHDGGPEGKIFVSRAAALARPPLRVYAPLGAAATADGRARRAVDALEAAGGLDRSFVLVALPTGSGWVNRAATLTLERLLGGDVATVAVQYSERPSWLAFLRGGDGAQASATSILGEVEARVRTRPVGRRPAVLVWGESLGALAGLAATERGTTAVGLLWAGVPASSPAPSPAAAGRTVLLTHPDDPVGTWRPGLLVRPGGRPEPWLPVATFWRASADVVAAIDVPPGHGHRYGPEYATAWRQVLERAGHGAAADDRGERSTDRRRCHSPCRMGPM